MAIRITQLFTIIGLFIALTSCTPQRYTQDTFAPETLAKTSLPMQQIGPQKVKAGDRITISVWGHEDLGVGSAFSVYNATEETGRFLTVDVLGNIRLPLVGQIHIAGMTELEAKQTLTTAFANYIQRPLVEVRMLGIVYSVLGETTTPGNFDLPSQGRTVAQAIAQAGGFTDYADLSRVSIMRNNSDSSQIEVVLDLGKRGNYSAPSMPLQAGDVIFIPARRSKHNDRFFSRLGSYLGALGAGILLFSSLSK